MNASLLPSVFAPVKSASDKNATVDPLPLMSERTPHSEITLRFEPSVSVTTILPGGTL